jgi:ACS family hexuronate transporter-like MFS transporter
MAPAMSTATGGIGDKIRGAMAVGKTRWGMLALVFYAIGFVLQGRLIDRVGVKRVFFCAVLLWSLATGAHGLATSAVGFMVCRFILGLTEAANYPACVKTTRLWFPAGERAVATGIFNAGTNVGAMFTPGCCTGA